MRLPFSKGRTHYEYRSLLICKTEPGQSNIVKVFSPIQSGIQELSDPKLVLAFTGEGYQYTKMARDLYNEFYEFRKIIDEADTYLKSNFKIYILKYILQDPDKLVSDEIDQTSVAQPLHFIIQYALACLLREFGLKPDTLIGHSIGEYTAACVSGVFDFIDALNLVTWRGKLMQEQKSETILSIKDPFKEILKTVKLGEGKIPVISNLTGTWIDKGEYVRDEYWVRQTISTMQFENRIRELLKEPNLYIIEIGSGSSFATLLSLYSSNGRMARISSIANHAEDKVDDIDIFLKSIGQAWTAGVNIDWDIYYKNEKRYRVPLPTYPFERKKHWIDPLNSFNYFKNTTIKS